MKNVRDTDTLGRQGHAAGRVVRWHRTALLAGLTLGLHAAALLAQETEWIAVVANAPGAEGSEWRSDVAILNSCPTTATVQLRLHTDDGIDEATFVIRGGEQQVFPDVVGTLAGGQSTGALEVVASVDVVVSSRTFNAGPDGTYGQSLDGVAAASGWDAGAELVLPQLREDAGFRTNIGVLNMGAGPATVRADLLDRTGAAVGQIPIQVAAGRSVQVNRPFRDRFGRSDIVAGFARLVVEAGSGVWPYASVVDNATGDPTTVVARSLAECETVDIAERLAAIDGLTVVELPSQHEGYRYFEMTLDQPDDHDVPAGPGFEHFLTLLHRDDGAPMVLQTDGYRNVWIDRRSELTTMLAANQLAVEHRFFGSSWPSSGDWSLLTIEQASRDIHRVVEAFKAVYRAPWISTGHSKSGMTAVFHRRLFPDDVTGTVAYVAPISYGHDDPRYVAFLEDVGDPGCRRHVQDLQRVALERRESLLTIFADSAGGLTFDQAGGLERAFEVVVLELPYAFWQYAGLEFCPQLPALDAPDQAIYDTLDGYVGVWYPSDLFIGLYGAYFLQAHHQLGYPGTSTAYVDDLLETDPPNPEAGWLPAGVETTFDPDAMPDIQDWLASEGERFVFIYGGNDPWTAGAFELGAASDSHLFVELGGTHSARIATLDPGDAVAAMAVIERWTGVTPQPPSKLETWPDRFPPWRPSVPRD